MSKAMTAELRAVVANLRAAIGEAQGGAALTRLEEAGAGEAAGLLLADARGHYVWANVASTRLLGHSRAALLRLSVWDVTPPAGEADLDALWRSFLRSSHQSGAYQLRTKSGRAKWFYYYAEPHLLPGFHISALKPVLPPR
jgi:PAS domain S-box-containing protein